MNADEKINLLIVGQQADNLASYEVILRPLGENVVMAASAAEALQCLLQTDVAVVLLDVDSSDTGALNTADVILQHSDLQKTPMIFVLDAPLTDLDQYREYRRGAVDFISPPVVPELLLNKVAVFADLHRKARQLEDALRQSERLAAMGQVAGVIAHEINNPLEAIANALFLVRSEPSLEGEAQHFARLAEEEVARIQHITQQTLSFYRESRSPISVSIRAVLDDVLDFQARRLQISQIAVERRYRNDTVIMGFPAELKQVFLNIIGNAIQAMPRGGRLRISTRESDDYSSPRRGLRVSVCDTGSGIQPEDAQRLFEPFFTTKSNHGTGLGLWVSKGIIEKYQGTIRFRSIHLYKQHVTCFSVFIPRAMVATSLERDAMCA
jgi:signal transduction histidine kinase